MKLASRFGGKLAKHTSIAQSIQSIKNTIRTHDYDLSLSLSSTHNPAPAGARRNRSSQMTRFKWVARESSGYLYRCSAKPESFFRWIRIGSLTEARSGRTGTELSERLTLREMERKVKENLQGAYFQAKLHHFDTNVWLLNHTRSVMVGSARPGEWLVGAGKLFIIIVLPTTRAVAWESSSIGPRLAQRTL